jgi:leader peptidase (prepilin peptidase)/N-methyltransferase
MRLLPWHLPDWSLPLIVAPFVGSFLGVLIVRLPAGEPAFLSRSACPHCGAELAPRDLIPLLSFALLRGRCRRCGGAIGWFHPVVEIAATAVAGWAALVDPHADHLWIDCLLGWTLMTLGWIDWRCMVLPDILTLPLALVGLVVTAIAQPDALGAHAAGAAAGYFSFQAIAWCYGVLRGREGLGGGDAKLLAAAGAWLGWEALPWIVLLAALMGLCAALMLRLRGVELRADTALPFGTVLATSFWIIWLHGSWLEIL